MSSPNVDEATPVPDYEIDQYFPRGRELSDEQVEKLRDQHGYLRTFFVTRPEKFRPVQRWLNQARLGVTYDVYLARGAFYALVAAVVGLVLGVLATALMARAGLFAGLSGVGILPAGVARVLGEYRVPLVGMVLTPLAAVGLGGGTWFAVYYYPRALVSARRREIDVLLPHAIVYMYALSHGGMNAFVVVKEIAAADEIYGEVANEFDMVVRDVELFGNDLFTALRDARNLTPSDNLEQFLDDMLSVLDSGSSFTGFLKGESASYMKEARQEQDDFLETLSILSEIFVVMFVAAPLFLIVTLMVISLLGADSLPLTYFLVYVIMPIGMVLFLLAIDVLSQPYAQNTTTLELEEEEFSPEVTDAVEKHDRFDTYQRYKRRGEIVDALTDPVAHVRQHNPLYSLAVTVPLALLALGVMFATGLLPTTTEGLIARPVRTTMGAAIIPFLIVTVPLTLLYESQHRREKRIASRFPDTLNILSSANQMGIRLTASLDLVARWSEGVVAEELRKVRNDIAWNGDVEHALLSFANRLRVPQVTRTMKLIAKGSQSSTDLSEIISIAAEDTRNRYQIEKKRRSEMSGYIAIVVIGFLVYLGVIVMLDVAYLQRIAQMTDRAELQGTASLLNVSTVPVSAYQTVFFHSALIMGSGTGLIAGKLADNDLLAGLKYSITLVALALAVFVFI